MRVGASLALVAASLGCDEYPGALDRPHVEVPWREVELPHDRGGTAHATQLLRVTEPSGDLLIANSFAGVLRYAMSPTPSLRFASEVPPGPEPSLFCYRVALHPRTLTVYCAGLYVHTLARLDAADGSLRGITPLVDEAHVQSLAVRDDALYIASLGHGLFRRAILPDGSLGGASQIATGHYLHVEAHAAGLVAISRERGVELDPERGGPARSLPGPALSARVRGGELWVAMGSEGVARIDLSTLELQRMDPECAVSAVDASQRSLVLGCRQGIRIYDLPSRAATRLGPLRAMGRASYGVSDVLVDGDVIYELDWRLLRVRSDRAERARAPIPDAPLGAPVPEGGRARVNLHNPWDTNTIFGASGLPVAARSRTSIVLEARADELQVHPSLPWSHSMAIASIPRDRPAPGNPLALGVRDQWVYVVQPDCALQWPDLEDLHWLAAHGGLGDGRGVQVIAKLYNPETALDWFAALWPSLRFVSLASLAAMSHPELPYALVRDRLSLNRDIGGPDDTLFLDVDDAGTLRGVSGQYRGRFPLMVERTP